MLLAFFRPPIGVQSPPLAHGGANVSGVDLHSQALLAAFLQSDAFRQVSIKLTDMLSMVFSSTLYKHDTGIGNTQFENFIERLVRHQAGVRDPVSGTVSILADQMLDRFTADLQRVAQEGGLTLSNGNLTQALIAFAMQMYYENAAAAADRDKTLFTAVTGGLRFERSDVAATLDAAKGYTLYFANYLASLPETERSEILQQLPDLLDWHLQAGRGGMTSTATTQRAFMLGGASADSLTGGTQNDLLVGQGGADRLTGGRGADILIGGSGGDTYVWNTGDGRDRIIDDGAGDRIVINGADGGPLFAGGRFTRQGTGNTWTAVMADGSTIALTHNSPWTLHLAGGGEFDLGESFSDGDFGLQLVDSTPQPPEYSIAGDYAPFANWSGPYAYLRDGLYYDQYDNVICDINTIAHARADTLFGSEGVNEIDGRGGEDLIRARGGDDRVVGGTEADRIYGGAGNDTVYADVERTLAQAIVAGEGAATQAGQGDWADGGAGDDQLIGGATTDVLAGGGGRDLLVGGGGDDLLLGDDITLQVQAGWTLTRWVEVSGSGEAESKNYRYSLNGAQTELATEGDDTIYAGAGNDWAFGGVGNDTVYGGAGNDVLFGQEGSDALLGGAGNDMVNGDEAGTDPARHGDDYIDGGAGDDELFGGGGADVIMGGAGDDRLEGDDPDTPAAYCGADSLEGGEGADTLLGFGGDDSLSGGAGDDTAYGGEGNDSIAGGAGNDTLVGEAGNDVLDGGEGMDLIDGGEGNDVLAGGGGDDGLDGGDGNDTLDGGAGADALVGGAGDDTYVLDGSDTVYDVDGDNVLDFGAAALDDLTLSQATGTSGERFLVLSNASAGTQTRIYEGELGVVAEYRFGDVGGVDHEGFMGAVNAADLSLQGTTGGERLIGGRGNDLMNGGVGDDLLKGGAGDDTYVVNLGDGADTIDDVQGANRIRFGAGIAVESLDVAVSGMPGLGNALQIGYGTQGDSLRIRDGALGTVGAFEFADGTTLGLADILRRSNGIILSGGDAGETLYGSDADDYLAGAGGGDVLYGQAGNDRLAGGAGEDVLAGGAGADALTGGSGADRYLFNRGDGADVIEDDGSDSVVAFGAGIVAQDLSVAQSIDDHGVRFLDIGIGGGDLLRIRQGELSRVREYRFADGSVLDHEGMVGKLSSLLAAGTDADERLVGTAGGDVLDGGGGGDVVIGGAGNDVLSGGAGNDVLSGGDGEDFVFGGRGDDALDGGEGTDTYQFGLGMGSDTITESGVGSSVLQLDEGMRASQVTSSQDGEDLLMAIRGRADGVRIRGNFGGGQDWEVRQLDGTAVSLSAFLEAGRQGVGSVEASREDFQAAIRVGQVGNRLGEGDYRWGADGRLIISTHGTHRVYGGTVSPGLASYPLSTTHSDIEYSFSFRFSDVASDEQNINVSDNASSTSSYTRQDKKSYLLENADGSWFYYSGVSRPVIYQPIPNYNASGGGYGFQVPPAYVVRDRVVGGQVIGFWLYPPEYFTASGGIPPGSVEAVESWVTMRNTSTVSTPSMRAGDSDNTITVSGQGLADGGGGNDRLRAIAGYGIANDTPGAWLYGNDGDDSIQGGDAADVLLGGRGQDVLDGGNGSDTYRILEEDSTDEIRDNGEDFQNYRRWFYRPSTDQEIARREDLGGKYDLWGYEGPDFDTPEQAMAWMQENYSAEWLGEAGIHSAGDLIARGDLEYVEPLPPLPEDAGNDYATLESLWRAGVIATDSIAFGPGITADNLEVRGEYIGQELFLRITQADGAVLNIKLADPEDPVGTGIERFVFVDGSEITMRQMLDRAVDMPNYFFIEGSEGDDVIDGTENNDSIQGFAGNDSIAGAAGHDVLDGGGGADTLVGGGGNDTYLFRRGDGADRIDQGSAANGDFDILRFTGDISPAEISTNLDWEGLTLTVGATGDSVILQDWFNQTDGRLDRVEFADGTVWDGAFLDILASRTTGTESDDALWGTAGADTISALTGVDSVYGGAGNDMLSGGAGSDYLEGGAGDDDYLFNLGDGVDEVYDAGLLADIDTLRFGAGIAPGDIVVTRDDYSLYLNIRGTQDTAMLGSWFADDTARIERVEFAGGTVWEAASLEERIADGRIAGTAGNDRLTGAAGRDIIEGFDGNDVINGAAGADTLIGGLGNDTYYVDNADDIVTELLDEGTDRVLSTVDYVLGENVENLTLSGIDPISGIGNALANVIAGNAASNTLDGLGGDDRLTGGASDDILIGGEGNDVLNGSDGADAMAGNLGNDTYYVDDTGDTVTELADEGADRVISTVSYTLGDNVENLTLSGTEAIDGTGNALNNVIVGNAATNSLDGLAGDDRLTGGASDDVLLGGEGNDVLNGAAGADVMAGGLGNDSFYVDDAGDRVMEQADEGTDRVISTISYTLGDNVENLTLSGTEAIDGTGNALNNVIVGNAATNSLDGLAGDDRLTGGASDDVLLGGEGNDVLNGSDGADAMAGNLGNDTYYVDDTGDTVTELADEGADRVISTVSYTLGDNVENLTLSGTGAIIGAGNALDNALTGNSAINLLVGGDGIDRLNGGAELDFLEGGAGNDVLADAVGAGYFNGGSGNDSLRGDGAADFYLGGAGNDSINTGTGADVIVFNLGDGQDTVAASIGADNTISLGGGIAYSDIAFRKSGNNLILDIGVSDRITLANWYAGTDNHSVLTLQVIAEAMAGFDAGGADPLRDNRVETFDFAGLAGAFDAALAANPGLTSWEITNALTTFHLSGNDTAALGGDLAYQYGRHGNMGNVGLSGAQNVLGNAQFGTVAQSLQPLAGLQEGVVRLI